MKTFVVNKPKNFELRPKNGAIFIDGRGVNVVSHGPENAQQRNFESSKQKKENKIKTYQKIENILTYIFYVTGLISVFVSCIFMNLNPPLSYIIFYAVILIVSFVCFIGAIIFNCLIIKKPN